MLLQYETLTQALLQAPSSPIPLIPTATLDTYINQARYQVAAQGRCIRQAVTLPLAAGNRSNSFLSITGLGDGVASIYHIRQLLFAVASGYQRVSSRPYEWFALYALNNPTPLTGPPKVWTQLGQGQTGTIYVDPIPDMAYTCLIDVLGYPNILTNDFSPEAIPPIWTLTVPFYAAWLAFMSAQRQSDADMMMKRFEEQMALARNAANPDLIMENWSQSNDPMLQNRLGIQAVKP